MRRFTILWLFLALAGIFYFTRSFWLPWVAQALVVSEKPEVSDVIVILNGNNVKKRMDHAVTLYKEGYAKKILISGSWELERETGVHLGEVYLEKAGVAKEDIILENQSRSTRENAIYAAGYLTEHQFKSFILVTSPAHSFRAHWIFKKFVPKSIHWISNSNPKDLDTQHWWQSIESCREVFYEYLTLILSALGQIG